MRTMSIRLSDTQITHLNEIKKEHGITISDQVRQLIKNDIQGVIVSETTTSRTLYSSPKTIERITREVHSKDRKDLMSELKEVLAKRQEKINKEVEEP